MRRLLIAAVLLSSCSFLRPSTGFEPGRGVRSEMAVQFCGTREAFDATVEEVKASGVQRVPQSGDSACDVIATLGAPGDVQTVDVGGSRAMHLWYWRGGSTVLGSMPSAAARQDQHLVVVTPNERGAWFVESVVW